VVSAVPNPALNAFVAHFATEFPFGEVLLRRFDGGFRLTHVEDRDAMNLREVKATELRDLAQFSATKQFRPLKSAPNLQRGWVYLARNTSELEFALDCFYPGAVADWFAVKQPDPPITHYRDFTTRQTGMYRVTAMLTDEQAAQVARAGCHRQFCLKQRVWTVSGLAPDSPEEKSAIPCLEPCAVLLEFARTAARLEQREKRTLALSIEEWETCVRALEHSVQGSGESVREADFAAVENPRRGQLLLEKLKSVIVKGEHEAK
jgi:hypothetical protein